MKKHNSLVDAKDLLILHYLRADSKISLADMSKKIDLTPAGIAYRIKNLVNVGVIKKFTIEINQMLLTPKYQSYLVQLSTSKVDLDDLFPLLNSSRFFEKLMLLASSNNLLGITTPLSSSELKGLIKIFTSKSVSEYQIIPIVENLDLNMGNRITSENISNFYCPECQETFRGEGFVEAIGNKVFSFGCRECMESFREKYMKISKNKQKKQTILN